METYKVRMSVLILAAVLCLPTAVFGDDYQKGIKAHQSKDYKEAVKWFSLAAEQGHAKAQNALGLAYAMGQGVIKDHTQAHKWANLATANGYADGRKLIGILEKGMTQSQLAEAQRLAREWMESHRK